MLSRDVRNFRFPIPNSGFRTFLVPPFRSVSSSLLSQKTEWKWWLTTQLLFCTVFIHLLSLNEELKKGINYASPFLWTWCFQTCGVVLLNSISSQRFYECLRQESNSWSGPVCISRGGGVPHSGRPNCRSYPAGLGPPTRDAYGSHHGRGTSEPYVICVVRRHGLGFAFLGENVSCSLSRIHARLKKKGSKGG